MMLVFGLTMICDVESCFANMIILDPYFLYGVLTGISASFFATVVVEFVVIYIFLGRPSTARGWLFLRVMLIHLISYPLAQIGVVFLPSPGDAHIPLMAISRLCVVELLVVVLDYALLKRVFAAMHRTGKLGKKVSNRRTLKIAFAANFTTFLLSILAWVFFWQLTRTSLAY